MWFHDRLIIIASRDPSCVYMFSVIKMKRFGYFKLLCVLLLHFPRDKVLEMAKQVATNGKPS